MEQQPAVLNTLLSSKIKRGEPMSSLTEDNMTLIPEVIKLMSPPKVSHSSVRKKSPPPSGLGR